MRYERVLACLAVVVLCVGCHSRPATLAVQGEVSYDGQAVQRGQIDFVPVDNTPGSSAIGAVNAGRYEIPVKWGLRPDGVYLVRIIGYRKTGKKEPNRVDRGGPAIDVEENFIPAKYNSESTLKVRVADLAEKKKVDFHLGKMPAAASH